MIDPNELKKGDLICVRHKGNDGSYREDVFLFLFSDNLNEKNKLFFAQRLKRNFKEKSFENDNTIFSDPINFLEETWNFFKYKGDFKYRKD